MGEFIKHFGIDWKLLLAQAINFCVLFYLLRRFAWGPLLSLMRERRRKIEEGLAFRDQAEENLRMSDSMREEAFLTAMRDALEIVTKAEGTAKERHEDIMKDTNKKVEQVLADARRVIDGEKQKMSKEVYDEAEEFVRLAVARIIGNTSPAERDAVLIREALTELKKI